MAEKVYDKGGGDIFDMDEVVEQEILKKDWKFSENPQIETKEKKGEEKQETIHDHGIKFVTPPGWNEIFSIETDMKSHHSKEREDACLFDHKSEPETKGREKKEWEAFFFYRKKKEKDS